MSQRRDEPPAQGETVWHFVQQGQQQQWVQARVVKVQNDEIELNSMPGHLLSVKKVPPHGCKGVMVREGDVLGQCLPVLLNSARLHQADQWEGDTNSHSKQVVHLIQQRGASVVVFVRAHGIHTHDPTKHEVLLLQELSREPHISVVLVLWTPPPGPRGKPDLSIWQQHAGYVEVALEYITSHNDLLDFERKLLPAELVRAKDNVSSRMEQARRDVEGNLRTVSKVALPYLNALQTRSETPGEFHQHYEKIVRKHFEASQEQLKSELEGEVGFALKMPDQQHLIDEYMPKTLHRFDVLPKEDGMSEKARQAMLSLFVRACPFAFSTLKNQADDDKKDDAAAEARASSLEELPARLSVFKMLMGQAMVMARAHAEKVYSSVVTDVFACVGGWFDMSPQQFQAEMSNFQKHLNEGDLPLPIEDWEEKRLTLLLGFLDKENFISMYVGCIISLIGPMLYCTVLPTMFDPHTKTVSADVSDAHLAEFKKFMDASIAAQKRTVMK